MNIRAGNRGMAGIILIILALGFMMAVSFSYVVMIQGETKASFVGEKVARAKSAALAGPNFVMARLLATSTTFLVSSQNDFKKRLYFAFKADATEKNRRFSGLTPTSFTFVATSSWFFADIPMALLEDEVASSSLFRVTSYPATDTSNNVVSDKYYVKSQGVYRDIQSGFVNTTYSFQIIARLLIATPTRQIYLETWRAMELEGTEYATSSFFCTRQTIYPY